MALSLTKEYFRKDALSTFGEGAPRRPLKFRDQKPPKTHRFARSCSQARRRRRISGVDTEGRCRAPYRHPHVRGRQRQQGFDKELEFTDFPVPEITLWFTYNTILLPSEY